MTEDSGEPEDRAQAVRRRARLPVWAQQAAEGFVSGLALGAVGAVTAIPISMAADRLGRRLGRRWRLPPVVRYFFGLPPTVSPPSTQPKTGDPATAATTNDIPPQRFSELVKAHAAYTLDNAVALAVGYGSMSALDQIRGKSSVWHAVTSGLFAGAAPHVLRRDWKAARMGAMLSCAITTWNFYLTKLAYEKEMEEAQKQQQQQLPQEQQKQQWCGSWWTRSH
eukprot:TRINITY_DN804_c0_g1_i1.p1 TRINITY_DN804_c0_g1~~TRINITY_DN804_c0_g1_i1.p1  ORF type:complete len:223 (+),score=59.59 TRINITY_DN804_c0_g1_i1:126-794(+)